MATAPDQQPSFDMAKMYVWIKSVESKVNNLIREVDLLKNDLINKNTSLKKESKSMNDDLVEVRHEQEKTIQKMDLIIKELKQTAGIEELQTLKKYIEFWNPLHFVTQTDLERALGQPKTAQKVQTHKKGEHLPFQ